MFFALSREVLLDALDFAGQTLLTRRRVGASGATYVLAIGTDWPTLGLGDNLARRVADRIYLSPFRTTFHARLPVVRGVQQ